jgi:hypothetical protein
MGAINHVICLNGVILVDKWGKLFGLNIGHILNIQKLHGAWGDELSGSAVGRKGRDMFIHD